MEDKIINSVVHICKIEELSVTERKLVSKAIEATNRSYAKYSRFNVGAALLLENGAEIIGCNQENAAFSVTICAERTALFSAGAQYPGQPVTMLAIAARNEKGLLPAPVTPCGSCRQAMVEHEQRSGKPMRILLYGTECIYIIDGIRNLMPLSFDENQL